jgi:hypothetical protein
MMGLRAIDVDKAEILWQVPVSKNHFIAATPVIDTDAGKIYFYTVGYQEDSGYGHEIYQVDFNGENLRSQSLDFDSLFEQRATRAGTAPWRKRSHCKTAMGLNRKVTPGYVYFACSIQTGKGADSKYGAQRGLSGLVNAFLLDQSGNLQGPRAHRVFFASALGSNPMTGFDTGVYNSGSGPSLLPDGSLLVATGNGPVSLQDGNFGCSVVRLDGTTLQPMVNSQGNPAAFSHSTPPFNECWYLNVEYANSSVAVLDDKGVLTAAVISKDGYLDVFNPLLMDPSRSGVVRTRVANDKTYSQPVFLKSGNGARVVSLAKNRPYVLEINDLLLADSSTLAAMKNLTRAACYGWLSSRPSVNSPELSLLYSGPIRNDYAVAVKGEAFFDELTSFFSSRLGYQNDTWHSDGQWGPYMEITRLGFSMDPNSEVDIPLSRLERFDSEELYLEASDRKHAQYTHPEFWVLRNLDGDRDCPLPDHPELTAVYTAERHEVTYKGRNDSIDAHDFNYGDGTLRLAWSYQLDPSDQLMNTHPVISTTADGTHPVVLVPVYSTTANSVAESALLLIDGNSGKLLNRIVFSGQTHFSMPLLFDEKIVIPTVDDGLQILSASIPIDP